MLEFIDKKSTLATSMLTSYLGLPAAKAQHLPNKSTVAQLSPAS
jgi:hypothetical protein